MVRASTLTIELLLTLSSPAWRVDFNLALRSFDLQVKGLRNLIDLALASPHANPPRLLFTSSVAVLRRECA
jgi:nucleoside-diphosphate-sugar epimerase